MEEDDEMHSPASAGSGSPASNGRITVTVAVPSHIQHSPPRNDHLTLALPSQAVRSSGGREDCWSESATAVLIEAWGERYLELSRGNLKQKHWKEVADVVSSREDYGKTPKTDIQCKNRIDTVKKKYKLEKSKMLAGCGPSKWPFFGKLDHLIGATGKGTPGSGGGSVPPGFMAKNHKIPMGMPVRSGGGGGVGQFVPKHLQQLQKGNAKKRGPPPVEWDSDSSREVSPVSADSFLPPAFEMKRPRTAGRGANAGPGRGVGGGAGRGGAGKEIRGRDGGGEKKGGWGDSMRELTQAMLRFGEAYENAETAKLQQVVEMEKQRMKFAKELELQRMQFFMKTQMEISQVKHGRRNGNASNHHRSNNNNNSDSN